MAVAAFLHDVNDCVSERLDVMQRTYKLFLHDIEWHDHSGDNLPTEYECSITGESDEDDAVQVALQQLSDKVGRAIDGYDHDVQALTVTFPE